MRTIFLFCVIVLGNIFSGNVLGQSLPKGKFLSDSIEVGKPFFYALSFRHAPKTEVFFPDTTYNFSTFEVLSKKNFTSSTDQKGSLDSAVYQLVTFNITPGQTLKIPVFVFNGKDCTSVFTTTDSIFLRKSNFKGTTDRTSLKPEVGLLPLRNEFNFSIFIGFLTLAIGVAGSVYWLFGSDIYKQWQLFKLQRRHMEYNRTYNRLLKNAREHNDIKDAEKAIIVWKNYLERLEKKPFATYTTREIMDNMPDEGLAIALKNMDGIIYGQGKSKEMDKSLEVLKMGAMRLYRNKRRQILENNLPSEI
ncbi:hypothetical protein [Dyadobacter frigoris]|uniref:hypothetical protein n=1 Tax=Dyadobacter frigoris TaxID=2576211 RepID=UPI001E5D5B74|nr:hypothetical protein [Dyadobacter frigoris]